MSQIELAKTCVSFPRFSGHDRPGGRSQSPNFEFRTYTSRYRDRFQRANRRGGEVRLDAVVTYTPGIDLPHHASRIDPESGGIRALQDLAVIAELKVASTAAGGLDHTEACRDFWKLSMLLEEADSREIRTPLTSVGVLDNHPTRRYRYPYLVKRLDREGFDPTVRDSIQECNYSDQTVPDSSPSLSAQRRPIAELCNDRATHWRTAARVSGVRLHLLVGAVAELDVQGFCDLSEYCDHADGFTSYTGPGGRPRREGRGMARCLRHSCSWKTTSAESRFLTGIGDIHAAEFAEPKGIRPAVAAFRFAGPRGPPRMESQRRDRGRNSTDFLGGASWEPFAMDGGGRVRRRWT